MSVKKCIAFFPLFLYISFPLYTLMPKGTLRVTNNIKAFLIYIQTTILGFHLLFSPIFAFTIDEVYLKFKRNSLSSSIIFNYKIFWGPLSMKSREKQTLPLCTFPFFSLSFKLKSFYETKKEELSKPICELSPNSHCALNQVTRVSRSEFLWYFYHYNYSGHPFFILTMHLYFQKVQCLFKNK